MNPDEKNYALKIVPNASRLIVGGDFACAIVFHSLFSLGEVNGDIFLVLMANPLAPS